MRIYGDFSKISELYNKNKKITKTNNISEIKNKKDVVSISDTAKDFQTLLEEVRKTPDVREEKINELKAKYKKGNYNVSPKEIANKMISGKKIIK